MVHDCRLGFPPAALPLDPESTRPAAPKRVARVRPSEDDEKTWKEVDKKLTAELNVPKLAFFHPRFGNPNPFTNMQDDRRFTVVPLPELIKGQVYAIQEKKGFYPSWARKLPGGFGRTYSNPEAAYRCTSCLIAHSDSEVYRVLPQMKMMSRLEAPATKPEPTIVEASGPYDMLELGKAYYAQRVDGVWAWYKRVRGGFGYAAATEVQAARCSLVGPVWVDADIVRVRLFGDVPGQTAPKSQTRLDPAPKDIPSGRELLGQPQALWETQWTQHNGKFCPIPPVLGEPEMRWKAETGDGRIITGSGFDTRFYWGPETAPALKFKRYAVKVRDRGVIQQAKPEEGTTNPDKFLAPVIRTKGPKAPPREPVFQIDSKRVRTRTMVCEFGEVYELTRRTPGEPEKAYAKCLPEGWGLPCLLVEAARKTTRAIHTFTNPTWDPVRRIVCEKPEKALGRVKSIAVRTTTCTFGEVYLLRCAGNVDWGAGLYYAKCVPDGWSHPHPSPTWAKEAPGEPVISFEEKCWEPLRAATVQELNGTARFVTPSVVSRGIPS